MNAINGLQTWLNQLDFHTLLDTLIIVAASLLCITFHETCHGFCAYLLGDKTAKKAGRLSLNPLRHVDLVGLLMMAVCKFGWAKPVPVDMRNFKNPKTGMALTALAGPLSNVILSYLAILVTTACYPFYALHPSKTWEYLFTFLAYVEIISAGLAVFNIFPIPPLDGSKVLFSFLPQKAYSVLMKIERYGMLLLVALLFLHVLDVPLLFLRNGLLDFLESVGVWPAELISKLIF